MRWFKKSASTFFKVCDVTFRTLRHIKRNYLFCEDQVVFSWYSFLHTDAQSGSEVFFHEDYSTKQKMEESIFGFKKLNWSLKVLAVEGECSRWDFLPKSVWEDWIWLFAHSHALMAVHDIDWFIYRNEETVLTELCTDIEYSKELVEANRMVTTSLRTRQF